MTDKQLIRFVKSFRSGILGSGSPASMCFAVCAPLQSILSISGVETKLIEGEIEHEGIECEHFWLELKDGRIIDPTASQFKDNMGYPMPDIFFGQKPEWYKVLAKTITIG